MCQKSQNLIIAFFILSLLLWGVSAFAQTDLQYQRRSDRMESKGLDPAKHLVYYEGVKPRPVSGYDIVLISVLANYREGIDQMPDQYKVKFYLRRPSEVHLTVRELDSRHYYWLDRVMPAVSWRPGFVNVFEWSTDPVIKHLKGLGMYDLGVLVRLGRANPSSIERVAPAILYHSAVPQEVAGYLFTFKPNGDARISCSIYKEGQTTPVFEQRYPRKLGGRPFTVRWNVSGAEAGVYKVLITGYFLNTNSRFKQSVEFYHQSNTN